MTVDHNGKLERYADEAAGASEGQEPVAIYHGNGIIDCGDAGHHNIELLKMIPAGAKLYKDPSAELAALRERIAGMEKDAERWRWLKMRASVGDQRQIMSTPWGQWDAFADAAIAKEKQR